MINRENKENVAKSISRTVLDRENKENVSFLVGDSKKQGNCILFDPGSDS